MLLWIADFAAFWTTDFVAIPGDSVTRRGDAARCNLTWE